MTPAAKKTASSTAKNDPNADVAELSYEAARDELLDVVRRLESGTESLEGSLALWERGEALAKRCETWLDGARQRIDEATGSAAE
ncbi:exodeoxyribonuclease VII small subunit [Spongisporangium articulatum]|uniref:Exodeoxyribonuclease 7 small subunit n=1 Tax=Spongisporangium articulatum TaxID=3362603 RepID=A0ABW8AQB3_9ACTN